MTPNYFPAVFFVFGTIIGSFLNVVALRTISGQEIIRRRSFCRHCNQTLAWYELVPVLSWIFLQGRCRRCRQIISPQYPLVEIVAGACAATLLGVPASLAGILVFICACLLIILALVDWHTMVLPDVFIILLAICALASLAAGAPAAWISRLLAAGIGAGFLAVIWLATRGRGIGLGDVKLMAPASLLLGTGGVITALFLSFIAGGIYGSYLLVTKQATPKTAVPFGPFLAASAILCLIVPSIIDRFITFLGWPIL